MKKLIFTLALSAGLLTAARADIIANPLVGGAASGTTLINFDGAALGAAAPLNYGDLTVSFGGVAHGVVQGNVHNQYAPPVVSGSNGIGFGNPGNQAMGPDATHYLSTSTGSITLSFANAINYVGFLWGSVDDFNSVEFWSGGSLVKTLTGLDITASANGNQGVNGTYYVNFSATDGWDFDAVVLKSTTNSFEIDNLAYGHVPDSGATIAMLGAACAVLGLIRRKR